MNYLPEVWLAPTETRQLRRLAHYRRGLAEDRKRTKLRIRALLPEERLKCEGDAKPWTKPWMKWGKEEAKLGAQAAQRIGNHDEKWKALKQRLVARGKPKSVAVAAVANRWIRWLYYQIVKNAPETTSWDDVPQEAA